MTDFFDAPAFDRPRVALPPGVATPQISDVVNRIAAWVSLERDSVSRFVGVNPDLCRAAGAQIGEAGIAGAMFVHRIPTMAGRRASYQAIGVDRARPSFGRRVGPTIDVLRGTARMRGVAATTHADALGRTHGIMALVDAPTLHIVRVGADAPMAPRAQVLAGIGGARDVVPCVNAGRFGSLTRILFAYVPSSFPLSVHVGFLSLVPVRGVPVWFFEPTAQLPLRELVAEPQRFAPTGVYDNIVAAFDEDAGEWLVAWMGLYGSTWAVTAVRIGWDGRPLAEPTFLDYESFDDPHSGMLASYHRGTREFLLQFQHNSSLVVRDETGALRCRFPDGSPAPSCLDRRGDLVPRHQYIQSGGIWASQVCNFPGFRFRWGGQCASGIPLLACTPGAGVSFVLDSRGRSTPERSATGEPVGVLWPPERPSTAAAPPRRSLHAYVRCPRHRIVVMLHVRDSLPYDTPGQLAYTFGEDTEI